MWVCVGKNGTDICEDGCVCVCEVGCVCVCVCFCILKCMCRGSVCM